MTSIDDWSHRVKAALLRRVQSGFLILTVAGRAQLPAARRWGRLGTPASGRHSPPEAGGGKDSQLRGGPFSAGISAFGGIRTLEWQTPFVAVRTTCLRFVKADGKEPPVALGSLCRVPPGETRTIGPSAHQARQKMPRHSRWLGAASSVLVSRSRACRPEAGVPSRPRHDAIGSTPSRAHPHCRRPAAAAFHGNRWEVGAPIHIPSRRSLPARYA